MGRYEEHINTVGKDYPFLILFCGREACPPGYPWGGVRSHYLFHYVLDGNGQLDTGKVSQRVYRGGGFFLFPGQSHAYRADTRHPWTYIWLGIGGDRTTGRLFEMIGFTPETPTFQAPFDQQLGDWMHTILETLKARPAGYPLRVAGYANLVFSRLAEIVPSKRMSSLHLSGDVVRDVKTYMRNNYHSRNMSIRRIARFLGYDESTLYRRFRAAEGTGVQEYLRRLRLRESTRLLRETDLPVYQVAASVGLEYIPFSRAFRQLQGCTPRDYRKRRPAPRRTTP